MKQNHYQCTKCNYETLEATAHCPRCGGGMLSSERIRLLGWVQLLLGIFLVGMMGTIAFFAAPSMLSPGQAIEGQFFSGTRGQALFIFGLFGIVIAFGLITLVNGLWQAATGRRTPWLLTIIFVLLALLVVLGSLVYVVV